MNEPIAPLVSDHVFKPNTTQPMFCECGAQKAMHVYKTQRELDWYYDNRNEIYG